MPSYWSAKEERQYQHIKAGYGDDPRAREIAARTVNKFRGERKDKTPGNGSGSSAKSAVESHMRKGQGNRG